MGWVVACPLVLWLCLGYVGIDALCRCRLWVVGRGLCECVPAGPPRLLTTRSAL